MKPLVDYVPEADDQFAKDDNPADRPGNTVPTKPERSQGDAFQAAVQMTRMAMTLSDPNLPDNPLIFCNPAFIEQTGYAEEEALGRNCRFLQGPATDSAAVEKIRKAINT